MILYPSQLLSDLKLATVFLDTNVFSSASRNQEFADLLVDILNSDCALATIPSVVFEVTNGSSSLKIYNERADFIKSIASVINPLSFMGDIADFSVTMAKLNANNKSYTDFLLAACLYHYSHTPVFLMTKDLRLLPSFFDRKCVITLDRRTGDVENFGLYNFNASSYTKAVAGILKSK